MVALRQVAVISPFPFLGATGKGGAQVTFRHTYRALEAIATDCVVSADGSSEETRRADLVVSIDSDLPRPAPGGWRVLMLSNLAYDIERHAAGFGPWHRAWVPSDYLGKELVLGYGWTADRVDVLPPVLDVTRSASNPALVRLYTGLANKGVPRNRRLLFPHRSDPGKGLADAVRLLRRLTRRDRRWRLVVVAPSRFDDQANRVFFRRALDEAADALGGVEVVPWLPHSSMGGLYAMAGCTLVASRLPESFCMTAGESAVCGTPIVAAQAGALSPQHSPLAGVTWVEEVDSELTAQVVTEVASARVDPAIAASLRCRFAPNQHRVAVHAAIAGLVGSRSEHQHVR